jgi:restriction system protein
MLSHSLKIFSLNATLLSVVNPSVYWVLSTIMKQRSFHEMVIKPIFSTLWCLMPLVLLASIFKTPWFKGAFGEFQVNFLLKRRLSKDTYHLINNVTLPTDTGTTQIDHILVLRYGVFVIETKNMKGSMFASANQKQCT